MRCLRSRPSSIFVENSRPDALAKEATNDGTIRCSRRLWFREKFPLFATMQQS
jgi:hypothetical protein